MDYPQLNLIFGLSLIFTLVTNISLRVLVSKIGLPAWLSRLSWAALLLSLFAAVYIEYLFLRLMTPAFNREIGSGVLVIGGIGALVTAAIYPRVTSPDLATVMFVAQIAISFVSLLIAWILFRSMVPMPAG